MRDALKEGIAEGGQVCYRTDHHLTSLGNYLLYRAYQIDQGRAYLSRDAYQVTATDGFYGTTWSGSGYWFTKPDTVEVWDSGIQTKVTLRDGSADPIYSDSLYFPKHLEEIDKYPVFLDGNHRGGERPGHPGLLRPLLQHLPGGQLPEHLSGGPALLPGRPDEICLRASRR